MPTPVFKRILLKLSGEALAANQGFGVDGRASTKSPLKSLTSTRSASRSPLWLVAAISFAELPSKPRDMDRVSADHMGMLATVINALALAGCAGEAGSLIPGYSRRLR